MAATVYVCSYVQYYGTIRHECTCFADEGAAAAWVLRKVLENRSYSGVECEKHDDEHCHQCVVDLFDAEIKNTALTVDRLNELSDYFDSWLGSTWDWSVKAVKL